MIYMIDDVLNFWNSIKRKVQQVCRDETKNCIRAERYDVVSAPSNGKIVVKKPYGNSISIPYSSDVSTAVAGDTVIVIWFNDSLSTAKAWCFGNGPT